MQAVEGWKCVTGYTSQRWSRTDERKSATEREVLAVLWTVGNRRAYL